MDRGAPDEFAADASAGCCASGGASGPWAGSSDARLAIMSSAFARKLVSTTWFGVCSLSSCCSVSGWAAPCVRIA